MVFLKAQHFNQKAGDSKVLFELYANTFIFHVSHLQYCNIL